jgi:NADH-quinone oxidoreductase subunit I
MGLMSEIMLGARSLVDGMGVTIGHFFRKPVTVEYPQQRLEMSKAQRNAIVLIPKDEVGGISHNCIACLQCEKICPSACIKIDGERPDGIPTKRPARFDVNFALCSECGLCLDVCPTETLGWGKTYDDAGYTREFKYDLLTIWRDKEEAGREKLREELARKKAENKKKADADAKAKADAAAAAAAAEPKPTAPAAGGNPE